MKSNNRIYTLFAIGALIVLAIVIVAVRHSPTGSSGSTADLSQPASLALTSSATANTVAVGDLQHIRWTSTNYGAPTVAINIIRKVGDNPAKYELVRQVTASTKNDGDAVWVPALGDVGANTFIEVACTESAQSCTASPIDPQPLAVVNNGSNSNTAAAYQSIEAEYNN
jgi:hypothetical protein